MNERNITIQNRYPPKTRICWHDYSGKWILAPNEFHHAPGFYCAECKRIREPLSVDEEDFCIRCGNTVKPVWGGTP